MPSDDDDSDTSPSPRGNVQETEQTPLLGSTSLGGDLVSVAVQRAENSGTSWYGASFIVINAALGAGLLAFPQAYDRTGGVLMALLIQSFMLVLAYAALLLLAYCSDMSHAATYQDVVEGMCGRWGKIICGICIALYCFGTCITFLIIIGDQWDRFLLFVTGDKLFCYKWYMNRKFLISITSTVLILPLCFPRRIDFLKHVSALGVLSIIYISIVVIARYFIGTNDPGPIKTHPDHWTDIFVVVPTICFGYQCHVSVVPVYSCMKDRNLCNFTKTVTVSMIACALCYSTVAVFGYLTFGGKVEGDILVSYKPTGDIIAGIVLLAIKIYTTYPILHFCGRSAFESVLIDVCCFSPERIMSGEKCRRYVETVVWFVLTVILAITIPNITDVISLLGGLAVVFILVLPGVCWLQLALQKEEVWSRKRYIWNMIGAITFIAIGTFIFGITTTQAIMDDVSGVNDSTGNKPCDS